METIEQLVPAGDRSQEVDEISQAEAIRRAVASLPPKYRDVTVLYYFQDEDLAETSRIMSLPSGTVKARLHRARKMLETKLSSRARHGQAAGGPPMNDLDRILSSDPVIEPSAGFAGASHGSGAPGSLRAAAHRVPLATLPAGSDHMRRDPPDRPGADGR